MDVRLRLLRLAAKLDQRKMLKEADELQDIALSLPERGIFRSPKSKGGLRSRIYSLHDGKIFDKKGNVVGDRIDGSGNIYLADNAEPIGLLTKESIKIFRKKKIDEPSSKPSATDQTVFVKDLK